MTKTREERIESLKAHYARFGGVEKIQHVLDLDERYPELEIFGSQCISAEFGPGWKGLVEGCLKVLSRHGCKIVQIKQKFGGLRLYWDYPPRIESALNEWRAKKPVLDGTGKYDPPMPFEDERVVIAAEVNPVIARAESLSFRTCEDCGADVGGEGNPSWKTQCESCAKP